MIELKISIAEVISYLREHFKYATHPERLELAELLNVKYTSSAAIDDDFQVNSSTDILEEVQEQMKMVRLIRAQITSQGVLANPKDLQALVSTTTSLFAMLTKYSNDIVNQDRLKRIENAVVESIKTLDPVVQEAYFETLEAFLNE